MFLYKTISREAEVEQVIERSRFIGRIRPVESREEAEAFFNEVRTAHRQATHNVPAFVIGDRFQLQWASDDGEPSGTSGAPMMQMLVKEGITNAAVVITRYFGGIKLGTGGLVRAYTGTAKLVLSEAGVCRVEEQLILPVRMDYTYLGKLQNMAQNDPWFQIHDTSYADLVTVELALAPEERSRAEAMLSELTGGTAKLEEERIERVQLAEL